MKSHVAPTDSDVTGHLDYDRTNEHSGHHMVQYSYSYRWDIAYKIKRSNELTNLVCT